MPTPRPAEATAAPLPEPVRSPDPAPTDAAEGFRGPTPAVVPAGTPYTPDFSGTGCFPPDPPTPVEVTAFPAEGEAASGERVRLTLEIRVTQAVTVEHRKGQEFDFSVDHRGREAWRWSTVAPFVDPYGYRFTYRPGEVRRFSAVWDQSPWEDGAPPGAYVAHGFLIANMVSPPPEGRFICFDDAPLRVVP